MDDIRFKIAEAARMAGVSPSTLRLWETQDLIQPIRTATGQRLYDRALVERQDIRSRFGQYAAQFQRGASIVQHHRMACGI